MPARVKRVSSAGSSATPALSYPGTVPPTATATASTTPVAAPVVLAAEDWTARERAHAERADAFTAGWRERKPLGEKHAIEDFLFTYYPTRPAQLRRWHPGPGVVLARPTGHVRAPGTAPRPDDEPADPYAARAAWRWYRETPEGLTLDADAFVADRGDTVRYLRALLAATASRPGRFGCFGLHEWAMVYRDRATGRDHRHPLPLRLGHAGTDRVVESHPVQCSHFDAFRFFTPEAGPLNRLQPTRETQPALEQPGCLHATMDLYKWALKLTPPSPATSCSTASSSRATSASSTCRRRPTTCRRTGSTPSRSRRPRARPSTCATSASSPSAVRCCASACSPCARRSSTVPSPSPHRRPRSVRQHPADEAAPGHGPDDAVDGDLREARVQRVLKPRTHARCGGRAARRW